MQPCLCHDSGMGLAIQIAQFAQQTVATGSLEGGETATFIFRVSFWGTCEWLDQRVLGRWNSSTLVPQLPISSSG